MTTAADPAAADRRRRPRNRKDQILVAARELFVANGYASVSMAMIAEQVGITAGALYRHFANKAVLLERVIEDSFSYLDDPVTHIDYEDAVDEVIALVIDRPYLADLWTHELRHLPEDKQRALRRRMRVWNDSLRPALLSQRPDLDPGQVEVLIWAIQSMIACVGRQSFQLSVRGRIPAVRNGLRALTAAQLVPTGSAVEHEPQQLLPHSMRERLLLAALDQFGRRGFQDTSMASLGAAVDVTGPNLYSYFGSKADLLRAVFERNSHALWLGLDVALATSRHPEEALGKLAHAYIAMARPWASSVEYPRGGEYEQAEIVRTFRKEYMNEWVSLLVQTRPALTQRQAHLRVQLALYVVSDLYSNARLVRVDTFRANVAGLILAVLLDGSSEEDSDPT
ncbi:TetR/AcrR family transcriptional regulator [Nakamurella leprariae]|uniref:TetR/AcrR family transcriptional regulator n=1 Tax=Nakamurella leprariae TaxID=2803911 RepID=A0A938YG93_9ACTN|nr:TetR/AcrR family transcriptional regulator [Nakamurella leprariae]MBM9467827.1 TetR/AcrR family transcriptional regulator [Nakamurella leprariae]